MKSARLLNSTSRFLFAARLRLASLLALVVVSAYAESATVLPGQSVTLSATAEGTAPFAYQWFKDGLPLVGATEATYVIANFDAATAGIYSVAVANQGGTAMAADTTLRMAVPPTVVTQPLSLVVIEGDASTFTVVVEGDSVPLTYQWRRNGVNIEGATRASYAIAETTIADEGSYTVMVANSAGAVPSIVATLDVLSRPSDFNGDGAPDILLENAATGQRALWLMKASGSDFTPAGVVDLGFVDIDWTMAGTGDFNNDRKTDILWQNRATGQRALWLMKGSGSDFAPGSVIDLGWVDTNWTMAGTGDFNNDRQADILWQNTATGQRALWLMNGIRGGFTPASIVNLGWVDTNWTMAGSADFNNDRQADILWQNTATGQRALWLMNGIGGGFIPTSIVNLGWVDTNWTMAGTGDFNHDRKTDILWQNTATGQRALWLMNGIGGGFTPTSVVNLGLVPVEWNIAK